MWYNRVELSTSIEHKIRRWCLKQSVQILRVWQVHHLALEEPEKTNGILAISSDSNLFIQLVLYIFISFLFSCFQTFRGRFFHSTDAPVTGSLCALFAFKLCRVCISVNVDRGRKEMPWKKSGRYYIRYVARWIFPPCQFFILQRNLIFQQF